jgi:hypothetical protein
MKYHLPQAAPDPLYEAMKAAMLACPAGCSCRGTYTGPERRSVARHGIEQGESARANVYAGRHRVEVVTAPLAPPDLIPDVEADAAEGRDFYSWDRQP